MGEALVKIKAIKTHEDYTTALLLGIFSAKTLQSYEKKAFDEGLLDTDEEETSKTICWELARVISLYQTQVKKMIERAGLNESAVLKKFQESVDVPKEANNARRKTRNKKDAGSGQ